MKDWNKFKDYSDDQWELFEDKERKEDRWVLCGMIFCALTIAGLLIYVSFG